MRMSDWSSDVCSSDLCVDQRAALLQVRLHLRCVEQALFVEVLRARDARDFAHAGLGGQAQVGPVFPAAVEHRGALVAQRAQQEPQPRGKGAVRSEEHTSELQSLMRISYAVFCLKQKNIRNEYYND